MNCETIEYESKDEGIGILSLNRPRRYNLDMKENVKMAPDMNTDQFYRFQARLARLNLAMRRAPQPIICAVHGAAAGLGFSFALASDVRVITWEDRNQILLVARSMLGNGEKTSRYF
jgi:enoyl-CoA hydratase/carnithine racemase